MASKLVKMPTNNDICTSCLINYVQVHAYCMDCKY